MMPTDRKCLHCGKKPQVMGEVNLSGGYPLEIRLVFACDCNSQGKNLVPIPVFNWKTIGTFGYSWFGIKPYCPKCGKKLKEIQMTADPNSAITEEWRYKCKCCDYKYTYRPDRGK